VRVGEHGRLDEEAPVTEPAAADHGGRALGPAGFQVAADPLGLLLGHQTVSLGIPVRGVPTIVHQAGSSDPAGDLIIPLSGTVSQLYAQGMV